jgi:hypothetical protein
MALPPAWGLFDKGLPAWAEGGGFVDSHLLHSRDGRVLGYVAGDRTPFSGRGRSFGPTPSTAGTPYAATVAEVPCNLTPRRPPSQVLDNLPRYCRWPCSRFSCLTAIAW